MLLNSPDCRGGWDRALSVAASHRSPVLPATPATSIRGKMCFIVHHCNIASFNWQGLSWAPTRTGYVTNISPGNLVSGAGSCWRSLDIPPRLGWLRGRTSPREWHRTTRHHSCDCTSSVWDTRWPPTSRGCWSWSASGRCHWWPLSPDQSRIFSLFPDQPPGKTQPM